MRPFAELMVAAQRAAAAEKRRRRYGRTRYRYGRLAARTGQDLFDRVGGRARGAPSRAQLERAGVPGDVHQLSTEIEERDRLDRERAVSPLVPADDASILDSSDLTADEVVEQICSAAGSRRRLCAMNEAVYDACAATLRAFFSSVLRARVRGVENVPLDGPLIVASNHLSYFDPPALCYCPRRIRFMAKRELFEIPLLAPLIRTLGAYPVDRQGSPQAAIKQSLAVLLRGGRRDRDLSRGHSSLEAARPTRSWEWPYWRLGRRQRSCRRVSWEETAFVSWVRWRSLLASP